MKQIKTILMLVLVSAIFFSCSNARYGHLQKVKKNEKATVQKHERKNSSAQSPEQATDEVAVAEVTEEETEVVLAENIVSETSVASTITVNGKEAKTETALNSGDNTSVAAPNHIKEESKQQQASKEAVKKKKSSSGKSQVVALILCLLVGILGIHRFYLGYTTIGIIQLLTLGGCGIWAFIDLIRIIVGDLEPADGEYDETL